MAYNRQAAYDYAAKNWITNCHDKTISIIGAPSINVDQKWREMGLPGRREEWDVRWIRPRTGGGEDAAFVNGLTVKVFQPWRGLGDCAHFMSNTLTAGGIPDLRTDYVPYLNGFLRGLSYTKVLADEAPGERVERIINKGFMNFGDIILYVAPPGGELGGGYVHSAMFVSTTTITCHTVSRWNESWKAPHFDGYSFTLIHFSHDETRDAALDAKLKGWWKVQWRGQTYFYFLSAGTAAYSQVRPASPVAAPVPTQRGYYYPRLNQQLEICWPQTGSVEEFTLSGDGNSMTGQWNDSEDISATKL